MIERKLADFGVEVKVVAAYPGPVITRYEIEPAVGVKGSQITNLVKDLARALSVVSIRVVETIPGKNCMGLEIPNPKRQMVRLSEILGSKAYDDSSPLTIAMGKDIAGKPVVADLGKMPHVLVAGTTGSGKSVAINAMILSLVYKADPQRGAPDPGRPQDAGTVGLRRHSAPAGAGGHRHEAGRQRAQLVRGRNGAALPPDVGAGRAQPGRLQPESARCQESRHAAHQPVQPDAGQSRAAGRHALIVVMIDELADLMMVVGKKVEELIARLAQKARASGIHLVLATQRPSVDVITGLIKANIPTRIAFQVSSKIDSRTILDQMGAEALLGQGDMLYLPPGTGYPQRVHGAFVSDHEVHRVVEYLKSLGEPEYVEGVLESPEEAGEGGGEVGEATRKPIRCTTRPSPSC